MNAQLKTINLVIVFIFWANLILAQLKTKFDYSVYTSSDGKKSEMINVYKPAIPENILKSKSFFIADFRVRPGSFYPQLSIIDKDCSDFILIKDFSIINMSTHICNKNNLLSYSILNVITDFNRAGSFNSCNINISDPYKISDRNDFIRSLRKPSQIKEIEMFKGGNYYFLNYKAPQLLNIDYTYMDFHNIYFSGTEKNDINYATGKDMYYSRRGYFLSPNDNNPRYMNTQGIYNDDDDDALILLWLFDIFSEISRK